MCDQIFTKNLAGRTPEKTRRAFSAKNTKKHQPNFTKKHS